MQVVLPHLDTRIGDVESNAAAIAELAQDVAGCDVMLTPELAICGYPPRDLLFREGFVSRCEQALKQLASSLPPDMLVIVGCPQSASGAGGRCFNGLAACRGGRVEAWAHKRLLPGYDVFDDDRYFHPGSQSSWIEHAGHRIGLLVCEDLWQAGDVREPTDYAVDPVAELAEAGCDVLLAASASPFVTGKHARQIGSVSQLAGQHGISIVSLNRAGSEDDLAFDAAAIVADSSGAIRCLRQFSTEADPPLIIDLKTPCESVDMPPLDAHEQRFRALVTCVRGYVRKTGNKQAIIGLSGGIDSAVTAAIAAAALGPEHVTGVMMPSRHSSDHSLGDAKALAEALGLHACLELPIEAIHASTLSTLEGRVSDTPVEEGSLADQNIQARARGLILMALSNSQGGLVLSTGNKSELAAGYATLYGDMCGALSVLGDVLKMDVYGLARWMNEHAHEAGFKQPPIPESSITKPPSAELRPDQFDQDSLPPYELLDEIVRRWVEEEQSAGRIIDETGADDQLVTEVLRMIDAAQFKRDQAAVIPKVSRRAFGRGRPWPVIGRPGAAPVWIPAATQA
ncbi:MAG: NAD+ synthase [Planctomycetota bacterium]|nr:NAD+ synthase [Planctomycetota bacterium]